MKCVTNKKRSADILPFLQKFGRLNACWDASVCYLICSTYIVSCAMQPLPRGISRVQNGAIYKCKITRQTGFLPARYFDFKRIHKPFTGALT